MTSSRLNEVTYLRVFAILSLVAWHSYCSYTAWEIGCSPLDKYYTVAFKFFAPIANMPLFTFLSGYLFYFLFKEKGKYAVFSSFLKNKVNRLLIPYLVLGFVINLTQIGRSNPLLSMLLGAPNHMWYCLMLFSCFILCWFVEKKLGSKYNLIISIFSFLFVIIEGERYLSVKTPFGLWMVVYFYSFFYLGFLVFQYSDRIIPIIRKYISYLIITFLCLAFFSCMNHHAEGISSVLFVILLTTVARQIKKCPPYWMELVAKYSFGVYVFHQWIIWNITRYEPMQPIIQEYYVLFPIVLYISVFFFSLLLTHLSFKTRLGRYLLM